MKTLVAHSDTAIKIAFEMNGKLIATIPGGEKFEGQCTPQECEILAFRLNEASKGKITFDPMPVDFFKEHHGNIETLERQAEVIDSLRTELETNSAQAGRIEKINVILEERIVTAEGEVTAARNALKDARIEISLLNERIEQLEKEAAIVAGGHSIAELAKEQESIHQSIVEFGHDINDAIEKKAMAADFIDVEGEGLSEVKLESEPVHNERSEERDTEPPSGDTALLIVDDQGPGLLVHNREPGKLIVNTAEEMPLF